MHETLIAIQNLISCKNTVTVNDLWLVHAYCTRLWIHCFTKSSTFKIL